MDSPEIGLLSELRFQQRCVEKGIDVYAPINGTNKGVDAVIDTNGSLLKIQVKTASVVSKNGCTRIQAALSGTRYNKYRESNRYRSLFDYYAFVCIELNTIWLVPV